MTTPPSGFHRTTPEGEALVLTRTYPSPVAEVWQSLTASARLAGWIGSYEGDPARGFVSFTMNAEGEQSAAPERYEIRACEPPRLLRVRSSGEYGTWDLTAELEAAAEDGTGFTLTQLIDDPGAIENIGPGWEFYLDRLGAALTGGAPGAVIWEDYYPALRPHYLAVQERLTGAAS